MIPPFLILTANQGKIKELSMLLPAGSRIMTPAQVGLPAELPETGSTFEENALQKAHIGSSTAKMPCLADDSGLEVHALNGAPGINSARYAGTVRNDNANMEKLLEQLGEHADRRATFRTVLAFVDGPMEFTFNGAVSGVIAHAPAGDAGFGYDPIFIPTEGDGRTFAQMSSEEKNQISHRARALRKFLEFLKERY